MQNPRLASRYAKALYDLAKEKGEEVAVLEDMKNLRDLCMESRDFYNFVKSPIINPEKKISIFRSVLEGKVTDMTLKFVELMTVKGREKYLEGVAIYYIQIYNQIHDIKIMILKSASTLPPEAVEKISSTVKSQLHCHELQVHTEVDENLVGGFVIEVDNKLFDASVRRDLNDIEKQFSQNLYIHNIR